jgi:radical SAM protein with 4Fe4S-binding SPASM domain
MEDKRRVVSFELDITGRCNNNCRHCCINLPAGDKEAIREELSLERIRKIIDEAVSLGALWCLITGGEPLLREDFFDIYLYLKKKGVLVSVFTNATLIKNEHIRLFKKYPPRNIEVTVYGITKETYERVTRSPGSFSLFKRGLDKLLKNSVPVRLKAMALRSNISELPQIAGFCRKITKDYFRFDPFLHLRYDGDEKRNREVKSERLTPHEIMVLERNDPERYDALKKQCEELTEPDPSGVKSNHLFRCGAGNHSFAVSHNGLFLLCSSLRHPDCVYNLKRGSLFKAWEDFVPKVRDMQFNRTEFLKKCKTCALVDLCFWCPAHAYLESDKLDACVEYFCETASARVNKFGPANRIKLRYQGHR